MKVSYCCALLLVLCCMGQRVSHSQSVCTRATCPYLDPTLSPEQRAKDIVARMTLQEEVSQTMNQAAAIPRLGVPN
jgi:beta-glucosidase